MQATFCGSTLGSRAGEHFTTADFESMGYHLCDTLLDYYDPDMSKVSVLCFSDFTKTESPQTYFLFAWYFFSIFPS